MTESEWLRSEDPRAMLSAVNDSAPATAICKVSPRKLRLYACAYCRIRWAELGHAGRRQVEEIELAVDSHGELPTYARGLESCVWLAGMRHAWSAAYNCTDTGADVMAVQAHLLRDIVGNPFRPLTRNSPGHPDGAGWWQLQPDGMEREVLHPDHLTRDVLALARSIYEGRAFDRMPILGDALEEGGCTSEDVLRHCRGFERCLSCRGSGGFSYSDDDAEPDRWQYCGPCGGTGWVRRKAGCVRGCHVVDVILGKE